MSVPFRLFEVKVCRIPYLLLIHALGFVLLWPDDKDTGTEEDMGLQTQLIAGPTFDLPKIGIRCVATKRLLLPALPKVNLARSAWIMAYFAWHLRSLPS